MLSIKVFTFNPLQENTYLVYNENGAGVLIDPGCYDKEEKNELDRFIQANDIKILKLLNTHCHVDHVLGNAWAKNKYDLDLWIHQNEIPVLKAVEVYAPGYGLPAYEPSTHDHLLSEGDMIEIGDDKLECLFVPGHSPGHIVFYNAKSNFAICGDTLFRGSIGRTDLPGGNHQQLLDRINSILFELPETTVLFPGHGPETNVGFEKEHNPFVGKNAIY
ncbi:MBL fold metallo-hydrolase [Algoriphagus sediminis]|uniref:MBL fold metallo-hydrolase n=1 Tax=Algoriphagus sediminis TaxID=3057113 RepID=A0ABT7Y8T6_9BACT|nr:MBL fold metallo-hydrolase [Algoriphagus sediminis]MDN3202845.1 MBL fold metallo-hydrolase [Algoriphagus sediminis]